MINPLFLKTYISVVETKSFTETAKRLHMTQPGVSQHIKWLEDYFAASLLEREGKSFELTDQGQRVVEYAKQLFQNHESFVETLMVDDPYSGVCRFASPGSFGIKMYSFLLNLSVKHTGLAIHYDYAPNKAIVRSVLDDSIDVGFVTSRPDEAPLFVKQMDEEELRLIVPPKTKGSSFSYLLQLSFINHPDGFHHASRLLQENFPREFKGMDQFKIKGAINPFPVHISSSFFEFVVFFATDHSGWKAYTEISF